MSGKYDVMVGDKKNGIRNMPTVGVYNFFFKTPGFASKF
jgi:hypothetical protein